MKKFLRIESTASHQEIPAELDAMILGHAAFRARSVRRKRLTLKMIISATAVGAAAAVGIMCLPATVVQPAGTQTAIQPRQIAKAAVPELPKKNTLPQVMIPGTAKAETSIIKSTDMLALADTSALEQECYNLTVMTDYSFEGDSFSI